MEILEEEADISSDEDMIFEEEFKPSEDSTPLVTVHPPKRLAANGFPSPSDLTSPVSVLPKRQVISSTSFCNVVPSSSDIEGDALTVIRDEVLSPIDCLASALPQSESSTQILDDSSFPLSPSPVPIELPTPMVTIEPNPLLAQSNSNCDLIAIEHLEKNPRSDSPSIPSSAKELSYASVVNVGPLPKSTRNGNRIGFFKPYSHPPNSGKKIPVAVSGAVDPKKVASNNHITILKRLLNVSSQHTKPPSPVPSVSLKPDVNLSSPSLTLPSTSNPSGGKLSLSVYDIEPDGLNGKNRFEILNAIDESFSVLCDQDGAAFPIEPCTVGNHMIDICIPVNTNIQVAKVKSTQVQEKKSTSSSSCSQLLVLVRGTLGA
ncbi:hypothetical protein L2E82_09193 [Cichorium intybus]|uniref:Uncharacterized protein n=1 Tax=Cichorium intybus TaxID=13427 RepID=A0ACB9G9Q2_CICIN|nr:hypothetical protein L2E82_09193 [Cichorium intybus]